MNNFLRTLVSLLSKVLAYLFLMAICWVVEAITSFPISLDESGDESNGVGAGSRDRANTGSSDGPGTISVPGNTNRPSTAPGLSNPVADPSSPVVDPSSPVTGPSSPVADPSDSSATEVGVNNKRKIDYVDMDSPKKPKREYS